MTNSTSTQAQFFLSLKASIPAYSSLVDEIAETLNVSMDSAYRRIRGEKLLDFDELRLLCQRFNVSLDKFFSVDSNSIIFQGQTNAFHEESMMEWMEDVLSQLNLVNSHSKKHVYFLVKDMPPFHHYYHPALASFKFFFWMKSILQVENLRNTKFSIADNHLEKFRELTQKTIKIYNRVPTSEIWNEEGLNTTLRQIEVYHEMGLIRQSSDTMRLYQCVLEVIDHLEKMADSGRKSILGQAATEDCAEYKMYLNEIVLGDNTFMAELGDTKITYLNHSVMYFIGSVDRKFNDAMFKNLDNLMKRSTLISGTGEKERRQFFNKLRKKVEAKMQLTEV